MKMLLTLGIDIDKVNDKDFTLLHEAANIGNREIVRMILDAGCDPCIEAKDGTTAVLWAAQHDDQALLAMIGEGQND
jgi:ankyrin repeat protein